MHSILCGKYLHMLTFPLPSLAWHLPRGRSSIVTPLSQVCRPGQAHSRGSMNTAELSTATPLASGKAGLCCSLAHGPCSCHIAHPASRAWPHHSCLLFFQSFSAASSPHHPPKAPSHFPLTPRNHVNTLVDTLPYTHRQMCLCRVFAFIFLKTGSHIFMCASCFSHSATFLKTHPR